jgi:16S rRNA (adenine1518-N6/adenine1519-N6)-dimethyltransferase
VLRDQTLEQLKKHGLTAEATQDEQQLVDPEVITALVEASGLKPTDTVLEIGPGAGNITAELAKRAKKVYSVEKNQKFLPLLKERLEWGNSEIILGDALAIYLPPFDVLVSNLPYAIVEAIIQRLKRLRFRAASLLVPISFANILTAKRGEPIYSKLTLETNLFFHVSLIEVVKQHSYHPEPKTETALITLKPRKASDPYKAVLWHFLQQGDKKTANALREAVISTEGYPKTKREAKEVVAKLGLNELLLEKRVAALSLDDVELIHARLEKNPV